MAWNNHQLGQGHPNVQHESSLQRDVMLKNELYKVIFWIFPFRS